MDMCGGLLIARNGVPAISLRVVASAVWAKLPPPACFVVFESRGRFSRVRGGWRRGGGADT